MKKSPFYAYSFPNQKKWVNYLFSSFKICFLVFFVLISSKSLGQWTPIAPVNPPTGGFNIDGTLKAGATVGDWVTGLGGGYVLQSSGSPVTWGSVISSTTKFTRDAYNNTDDDIYTGSAFSDNPNDWKWTTGKATNKCDISTSMFHLSSSSNSKWIILGGDRLTTTGTSYIDFEFYQGVLTKTPTGGFTSFGPDGTTSLSATGGRTPNDFVLSMEYSNGGTNATVHYYKWDNSTGPYKYVEYPIPTIVLPFQPVGTPAAFGKTNGVATDVPYGAFGSTSYIPYAFVEAAVNIDAVLGGGCGGSGLTIKTVFVKTKASDSYNAALKDFVEPQPVNFQVGTETISYAGGPFCNTGTANPTVTGTGTYTVSPAGLVFSDAPANPSTTGIINLAASTPGTYTITYTYNSGGGCTGTGTTSVTINAFPTTPTATNTGPICAGSTLNLSTPAVTDATYSWTGPNSFTSSSRTPSISNATTAASGQYFVTVTVSGCTSGAGSTTATVNPIPATPTATNTGPICAGSTLNLSTPAVTDATYSWTGPNSFTSSSRTPSISNATTAATGQYFVTVTVSGCTSGAGSTTATVNSVPTLPAFTITEPTLCGTATGSINFCITISGYTYQAGGQSINGNGSGQSISNLTAGSNPSIVVTNTTGGCQSTFTCSQKVATCPGARITSNPTNEAAPKTVKQDLPMDDNNIGVKAYPNPFNDRVKFVVTVPQAGQGTLELMNMQGQKLKTIFSGQFVKGGQQFEMELPALRNATLIYVFRMGGKQITGKLVQLSQ